MRVELAAGREEPRALLRALKSVVIPRPIAWVSTRSAEGVDNLAPHSFFTMAGERPPIVQFTSVGRNDSLVNALATGEFVINLASEPMFERINLTGTAFPPDMDEFEAVGVEKEASATVAPPRVAGSPAAIECVTVDTHEFERSTVVFGEVRLIALDPEVMVEGHPEAKLLRPLSRLGKDEWGLLGEVRSISRVPYEEWREGP